MQSRYTSSWSHAPAGAPPSLPSSYLPMYTRPRWVRHPCRVGEYPCGGYGKVGAGQASWYASARRQVEKQRHVPMVLVQHGSKGENIERRRGAARSKDVGGQGGSKKGEKTRALQVLNPPPAVARCPRRHARPPDVSSRAVSAVRRARAWPRARACPAAAAVFAWRDRGGGSTRRQGASGRTSRPTACRRPGAPWLRGWEESWLQQWGGERWTNELRRWGGGCGGDVMDG